jgi:hypothetical protein
MPPSRERRRVAPRVGAVLAVLIATVASVTVPAGAQEPDGLIGGADPTGVAVFQPDGVVDVDIDPVPGAVSIAAVPGGGAADVWIATEAGEVQPFGEAPDHGDIAGINHAPVVAIAAGPSAGGYWLASSDGGVFSFGGVGFHGSMGGVALVEPIVAMAATPTGAGYWLVAADGGVFAFGDAGFHGSMGGVALVEPIVAMAATPTGAGYWLVAADGGVFSFGDARFHGSVSGLVLDDAVVGIASTLDGAGYWLVTRDGAVHALGTAVPLIGEVAGNGHGLELEGPVVGVAGRPTGDGYVIAVDDVVGGLDEFEAFLLTLSPERVAIWDRLAWCESNGNWSINTGNGFYGGVQFSPRSWAAVGGDGLPHQASRAEQIYRAERLLDLQGWGAWPGCSRKLGLR